MATSDPSPSISSNAAGQGAARGLWKSAIQQVQEMKRQQQHTGNAAHAVLSADGLASTPSIIQDHQNSNAVAPPATPKLAIMVHSVSSLPGSSDSGSSGSAYYVRAALHSNGHHLEPLQKQKTGLQKQQGSCIIWPNALLQLDPHGDINELEVELKLKRKTRLTGGKVVMGSARVPLREVVASPKEWGSKRTLQLTRHGLKGLKDAHTGAECTELEVQLFLSTADVPGPLRVLCATWNVGNALPPPPEQLRAWLKGANEGEHHLVAVAAQECNYAKDMRRYISQHKRSGLGASTTPAEDQPSTHGPEDQEHDRGQGQEQRLESAEPGPAAAAVAAVAAEDADGMLATQQFGSTRAMLKSKLVDAVDSSAMWERHISSTLGDQYWLVSSKHMFQTRLLLFARADVVPSLSSISSSFEATGIGHVGVNKGGVAVGLKVGSTSLAFIGSHLAAHQSKTQQRNKDVAEICHELNLQGSSAAAGADLVTGFHHVVWMGDLNYRLEYGQQAERVVVLRPNHNSLLPGHVCVQAVTQSDSPTPEDFASLCDSIAHQQYDQLVSLDQLLRERDACRVFCGFREGTIAFAPTFKVQKGDPGFCYTQKRSPAWCDRVLFKSALPHKQATCDDYFTVPDICTSDHKPVAAVVALPMATDTVSGQHRLQAMGAARFSYSSPKKPISPRNSTPVSPTNSWGSAAAAKAAVLRALSGFSKRSSTAGTEILYKLYIASIRLQDQETWEALALQADKSLLKSSVSTEGSSSDSTDVHANGSSTVDGQGGGVTTGAQWSAGCQLLFPERMSLSNSRSMRLQLVVSGSCMAGLKREQAMRLNADAVRAARTAEEQPSLLLREDSIQLLPGPLSQLMDDWLLVRLVLSEGWRRKVTLARGILPLQPIVAAYRSSYKAVPLTLQLENNSAAVGSLVCTVQLISSASIRAGMHEAIKRMRAMAAETRSGSSAEGVEASSVASAALKTAASS